MSKHTALPWETRQTIDKVSQIVANDNRKGRVSIADTYTSPLSKEQGKANIAHIVHCVNTHQALVDALESLLSECESLTTLKGTILDRDDSVVISDKVLGQAQEALKQAKEREA